MSRRGFTLIELLIVLAVLTIVAGMMVRSADRPGVMALEGTARVLAADLRLARSLSIQHGSEWTVRFDSDGGGYELVHTGSGDPPPPRNPLGPPPSDGRYHVDFDSHRSPAQGMVRIAEVRLAESSKSVGDIRFQPPGGTGPQRNEDTIVRLVAEHDPSKPAILLTVSWVTGQCWIDPIDGPRTKLN